MPVSSRAAPLAHCPHLALSVRPFSPGRLQTPREEGTGMLSRVMEHGWRTSHSVLPANLPWS